MLINWLTWIDTYGAPDGSGWKIPTLFSEYGFTYGTYDPGMAASVALGCLWIYLRNGDTRAATWARRLLDDLRENRWDPEFGGYKSDYHYAWLNALALRAFGIAAQGVAGQAYVFPSGPEDREHFDALTAWVFAHVGDEKPNVLNADLIPFYLQRGRGCLGQRPELPGHGPDGHPGGGGGHGGCGPGARQGHRRLVLVAEPAGLYPGETTWWICRASQIRSLTLAYEQTGPKNLVRVLYANYDQDNTKYAEAREDAAISAWGEAALDLDCRYGSPRGPGRPGSGPTPGFPPAGSAWRRPGNWPKLRPGWKGCAWNWGTRWR